MNTGNKKQIFLQQGTQPLRQLWREALENKSPGIAANEVLDRFELKYRSPAKLRK